LFFTITAMQMQGNMYYAFKNIHDFQAWSELFNLVEEDVIYQKRILAFVSGAILPLVALGFIKSLVDYIKPEKEDVIKEIKSEEEDLFEELNNTINDGLDDLEDESTEDWTDNLTDEEIDEVLEELENAEVFVVEKEEKPEAKEVDVDFEKGKNLFDNQVKSISKGLKKRVIQTDVKSNPGLADQVQQTRQTIIGGAELSNRIR